MERSSQNSYREAADQQAIIAEHCSYRSIDRNKATRHHRVVARESDLALALPSLHRERRCIASPSCDQVPAIATRSHSRLVPPSVLLGRWNLGNERPDARHYVPPRTNGQPFVDNAARDSSRQPTGRRGCRRAAIAAACSRPTARVPDQDQCSNRRRRGRGAPGTSGSFEQPTLAQRVLGIFADEPLGAECHGERLCRAST